MYDEITVAQLCNLYIEDTEPVQIWSCEKQSTVFEGTFREAQCSKYANNEVGSFGVENGIIVINITGGDD